MIFNIPPNKLAEIKGSLDSEIAARQDADTALQSALSTAQSALSTAQSDIDTLETYEAYRVTGTISSSALAITKSGITADMVPICCEFGTPSNVLSDYTITTTTDTVTFSNITLSASTTVDIILIKAN